MKLDESVLEIDYKKVEEEILGFIRDKVARAKAKGVVVGLSGGVDSSVVAKLCVEALGNHRVIGLLMPTEFTPVQDIVDAKALAESLKIKTYHIPIDPIFEIIIKTLPLKTDNVVALGNIRARTRMIINYYFANCFSYLVAGTGDRSEILIGYFTKYGDGGVDFLPTAHLYKTQVRKLGAYLKLPKNIVEKPSSPQLWKGQKATDEIPVDYPILDLILYGIFDAKMPHPEIARQLNVPIDLVKKVETLFISSAHKRMLPATVRQLVS
ncbi:NAD+ synthase [Candidatus Bathyarchaeota archaeon]|nr:NAD+ synthase [Candidatus Bathyarchaeota archaeon]